jgi:hypothetical protein
VQRIGARADRGVGHQDDVAAAVAQQRLGRLGRLGVADIEPEAAEAAGVKRLDEGGMIDQLGAGDVDQDRARLDTGERIRPRVDRLSGNCTRM